MLVGLIQIAGKRLADLFDDGWFRSSGTRDMGLEILSIALSRLEISRGSAGGPIRFASDLLTGAMEATSLPVRAVGQPNNSNQGKCCRYGQNAKCAKCGVHDVFL